jgi:pyroglutamyl-peptidase
MNTQRRCSIVIAFYLLSVSAISTLAGHDANQANEGSCAFSSSVVLVTGFEPFGDVDVNPSQVVAEKLNGQIINGATVVGVVLPVDFDSAVLTVTQAIDTHHPEVIMSLGLAANRKKINIETWGINLKRDPLNWSLWIPRRIDVDGPWIRLVTLPSSAIIQEVHSENIPVRRSIFAGMYTCNLVLYSVLGYCEEGGNTAKAGFLHLPLLTSQDPEGMELDTMLEAVTLAIQLSLS